jgi:hypothetical protein
MADPETTHQIVRQRFVAEEESKEDPFIYIQQQQQQQQQRNALAIGDNVERP